MHAILRFSQTGERVGIFKFCDPWAVEANAVVGKKTATIGRDFCNTLFRVCSFCWLVYMPDLPSKRSYFLQFVGFFYRNRVLLQNLNGTSCCLAEKFYRGVFCCLFCGWWKVWEWIKSQRKRRTVQIVIKSQFKVVKYVSKWW